MSHLSHSTAISPRRRLGPTVAVLLLTVASVVAGSTTASASGHGQSHSLRLQQRFWAWIAGSETNPAFRDGFCGEMVGNAFFLNAAFAPGTTEYDCTIPADTPVVFSPGGGLEWEEPNLVTDAQILAQRDIDSANLANPTALLDGRDLRPARTFAKSDVYRIPLAPTCLVKAIDPTVAADATSIRVASVGWTLELHDLDSGSHTLTFSDTIGDVVFAATFHLTVLDN